MTIPADIEKKAQEIVDRIATVHVWKGDAIADVATAIMEAKAEERERCAQIAEQWLVTFGEVGGKLRHTTPQDWANSAVQDIASAIRNEGGEQG
ncbi:hypothetical protein ACFFTN_01335 [Aminobacter aganoensis]|uniref:Uncharacterized protein n=1 Tax=Aminobacter aganoensis TaxID=83264 RepID=A0A7X0F5U1_9HYPH|nr:hypothetical protein [Aminobacter aganoensis]MBB6353498.1 hypothetical protein [Aminobacter aganoensis]